jgi:hypothetical protein
VGYQENYESQPRQRHHQFFPNGGPEGLLYPIHYLLPDSMTDAFNREKCKP